MLLLLLVLQLFCLLPLLILSIPIRSEVSPMPVLIVVQHIDERGVEQTRAEGLPLQHLQEVEGVRMTVAQPKYRGAVEHHEAGSVSRRERTLCAGCTPGVSSTSSTSDS